MKKRTRIMMLSLGVVFGGLIVFNVFKSLMMKWFFAHYVPPAVTVSSTKARLQKWEPRINAVGNFVAINGVEVNSQAAGNVVAIHFNSGQYINEGNPLIDIDDSVDQAILKSHQSESALQDLNYKRQTDLLKHGATSGSIVDESRAKLLQAQANVEKTEATIRQKHITAPFSGQLGIRQVNLGQYITPGQTSIVTLQSMDPLYLEFYLPEQMYKRLHINQAITFSVEQNPNVHFAGKITAINSKIDPNTHNIQVQATVPNCPAEAMASPKKSRLVTIKTQPLDGTPMILCNTEENTKHKTVQYTFIPGMFSAIEIEQPTRPDVVVLPTTAISYSLYGNSVYIIEKDKDDQELLTVKRVFVETGDQQGNYTVINSGVKAGQDVVSSGELKLQDGTRVIINNTIKLHDTENPDELGE